MITISEPFRKKEHAFARPTTCCGVVSCLCICATICVVVYLLVSRSEPPRRLWSPIIVDASGKETILGDTRQLEFWTPSVETKDYLYKDNSQVIPGEKWEVVSNNDVILQFGQLLHSNQSILGYRRVEVWGQGRSNFKPGWWWTVNVFTNYSASDMGRAYEGFWKASTPVFIEVIDNRGRTE